MKLLNTSLQAQAVKFPSTHLPHSTFYSFASETELKGERWQDGERCWERQTHKRGMLEEKKEQLKDNALCSVLLVILKYSKASYSYS